MTADGRKLTDRFRAKEAKRRTAAWLVLTRCGPSQDLHLESSSFSAILHAQRAADYLNALQPEAEQREGV